MKSYSIQHILFYGLVVVNTCLLLLPLWSGGRIAQLGDVELFRTAANHIVNILNVIICFSLFLSIRRTNKLVLRSIIIISLMMLLSVLFNNELNQLTIVVEFFLIYTTIFCCVNTFSFSRIFFNVLIVVLCVWSILPILYLPIASTSDQIAMFSADLNSNGVTASFGGFALHRNTYAFVAGLAFICCLMSDLKLFFKLLVISVLSIGLFLSASRGCILAVGLVVFIYYNKRLTFKQRLLFLLLFSTAIYLLFVFSSKTESRILFDESTGRDDIYSLAVGEIMKSPILGFGKNILLDIGHEDPSPVHNFILQTWLDYGLLALVFFLFLLFKIFKMSSPKARVILYYLLIVGFVQPYFTLSVPSEFTMISFFFIIYYNQQYITMDCKEDSILKLPSQSVII